MNRSYSSMRLCRALFTNPTTVLSSSMQVAGPKWLANVFGPAPAQKQLGAAERRQIFSAKKISGVFGKLPKTGEKSRNFSLAIMVDVKVSKIPVYKSHAGAAGAEGEEKQTGAHINVRKADV